MPVNANIVLPKGAKLIEKPSEKVVLPKGATLISDDVKRSLGLTGLQAISATPPIDISNVNAGSQSVLQENDNPKQSTLISQVKDIVNQYPINTNDKDMLTAFNDDNVIGLNKIRNAIVDGLTKNKESVTSIGAPGGFVPTDAMKVNGDIDNQIKTVNQTFDDYIGNISTQKELQKRQAIANQLQGDPEAQKIALETQDKEMLNNLGAQNQKMNLDNSSFKQRQLILSPENKAYRDLLEKVINSKNPDYIKEDAKRKLNQSYLATENSQYEREKSGLESVLNTLGMRLNDLKSQLPNNPDLQSDADNTFKEYSDFKQKYDTLDDKYPDVRIAKTARLIGDKISEDSKGYVTVITSQDVRYAADKLKKENPDWYNKYGSDVDYLAQHSNMIPLGGFPGGVKAGLYDIGKNIETAFGFGGGTDIQKAARDVTDETNTAIKGTKFTEPTRIVFDKNDNAYKELPNEDYGKINWNSSMRFLGQSAPSLAEFVLLDKGLGKAAKIVGELGVDGLLNISSKAAELKGVDITAEELAKAKQALSIGENTQNSLGLFGALTLTGHEQNRKIADNLINDDSSTGEAKKTLLANLLNLSSFAAFKMVGITPSAVIEKALQKGIANDALKLFNDSGWKLTEDQSENFFKESVLPKLKAIASTQGQNVLQGTKLGGAMILDENTRGLISSIANPSKGTIPSLKDDAHLLLNNIFLMTVAGLPQLVDAGFTPTSKDALYDAGLSPDENIGRINKMVSNGEIDQPKANQMISMVKTMADEVTKSNQLTNDEGLPLTVKQKRDIAVENFRKRAAEKLSETDKNINPEPIVNEVDATIKRILAENKFKSADDEPLVKIMNEGELTPEDVHATAKAAGIDFNSEAFKQKSIELTGEEHLDNMSPEQLSKVNDFYKAENKPVFRTDEEIDKILNPVDENGDKIQLPTSQLRLPMEVNDIVTGKPKMSIKEIKNRANALNDLINCL